MTVVASEPCPARIMADGVGVNATAAQLSTELTAAALINYSALLIMAVVPIWIGAFASLTPQLVSGKPAEKMSTKDVYMFPVIGSCVLFGLYLVFKFINKEYVNIIIAAYFMIFSVAALTATLTPIARWVLRLPQNTGKTKYEFKIKIPFVTDPLEINFDDMDIATGIVSAIFCGYYIYTKHWVMNNLLGLAFSVQGVSLLNLGSWKNGAILLSGLFVYDIFWVFGTDVMVTVAKNFDAPVKLLFPRDIFAAEWKFSMLGLGDIVIPGIYIALLLRMDASRKRNARNGRWFPKPYFRAAMVAYTLGLATTMGVMHFFKAAQPALLYLVPFCLGSSLLVALVRNELQFLFIYEESTKQH